MTHTITFRSPGDLVAGLPYQLGYHPRRSVVVIALHDRRMGLVARTDLPPGPTVPDEMVDAVVEPFRREDVDGVLLVGYEDEPDECLPLLLAVVAELECGGTRVVDVSVVRDGRRYSTSDGPWGSPPEGEALPAPHEVPGVADFVALGSAPLPDREALHGLVAADVSLPPPAVRRRAPRGGAGRRAVVDAWAGLLGTSADAVDRSAPTGAWVARAGLAVAGLADVPLRDALCGWFAPSVLHRDLLDPVVLALLERRLPRWGEMGRWPARPGHPGERRAVLDVLTAVCRAVPDARPADAAAACTLVAHTAWSDGDGALARTALDRALRLVPDYRLAVLLDRILDHAVRPPGAAPPHAVDRAG